MNRQRTCLFLTLACLALAGCVTTAPRKPAIELKGHAEPDIQGVTHVVKPGETLWRIAKAYQVSVEDLSIANHLGDGSKLASGQELFVPGVKARLEVPPGESPPLPEVRPIPQGDAPLAWPLVGVLYARFGPRGDTRHDGIDIAAPLGSPVLAAADGDVLFAGQQKGYGNVVALQHAKGLVTLYAHNQELLVKDGEQVKAGQPIAKVGEASKSTGPHIHFEVRDAGAPKDPLRYLPAPR
ncbi:MAG TPA: LysM peptidoglycan-binding domain-containing M23 family metallopeptidase [Myxococcales bacterium]